MHPSRLMSNERIEFLAWALARKMPFLRGLERMVQDRFAICSTKPLA